MPDQDIFNKNFAKGWGGTARKICRGASAEVAAGATARSLRKALKETGGIPDLPKLHDLLLRAENNGKPDTFHKLFRELRNYERNSSNRNLNECVKQAVKQTHIESIQGNNRHGSLFPTQQRLAKRVCENFVQNQLHSRIEFDERMQADTWFDIAFQTEYREQLNKDIQKIAKSLVIDPNFKKPPRFSGAQMQHLSTEKLLHKPIPLE